MNDIQEENVASGSGHERSQLETRPEREHTHPLSNPNINPLSDTTTDTQESPRPAIIDTHFNGTSPERPPIPCREGRQSWRIDHPYSSVYGLGIVEDENKALEKRLSASTQLPEISQNEVGTERNMENTVPVVQEGSDGTWNSNTLTLASSTANDPHPPKSGHDKEDMGIRGFQNQNGQIQMDWEETWERQKKERWQEKVRKDLEGWRGGHG